MMIVEALCGACVCVLCVFPCVYVREWKEAEARNRIRKKEKNAGREE